MAKLIRLQEQLANLIDEIYEYHRYTDERRSIEIHAVIRIQSWYRGLRLRSYIKHLNRAALVIQKSWRGHVGRMQYRRHLSARVSQMKLDFYNLMATKIQRTWRGYYSRRKVFDFYKRKEYLMSVQQKNEIILKELHEYKDFIDRDREEKRMMEKYRQMEQEAKKNHYLISTKMIPGVYNSPYNPQPNEKEYLMRNVKLDAPKKRDLYIKSKERGTFDGIQVPDGLPPLVHKPQGPFRDPMDVRKQRYRPFSPSLRVETDFESLTQARKEMKAKEWTERVHDEIFYPVHKSMKNKPYEKCLVGTGEYGSLDYGTKFFREELKDKQGASDFKTIVPSVPEFSKLNKTYVNQHFYLV